MVMIHTDFEDAQVSILPVEAKDTIPLRHAVLWPDRDVSYVSLPEDAEGYHFGAFVLSHSQDTPVGIISLFFEPIPHTSSEHRGRAARFRKFACHPDFQNRGIGTKLLEHVLSVAFSDLEVAVIWCDARTTSVDWYQRRGMASVGDLFLKGGLEYIRMQKFLSSHRTH